MIYNLIFSKERLEAWKALKQAQKKHRFWANSYQKAQKFGSDKQQQRTWKSMDESAIILDEFQDEYDMAKAANPTPIEFMVEFLKMWRKIIALGGGSFALICGIIFLRSMISGDSDEGPTTDSL